MSLIHRTRIVIAVAAFSLMFAGASLAEDDPRAVIGAQIEAFLADDFDTAFDFASPGIRRMFRTPENFGAMVRQGYPMVWRPAEVRYGASETRGAAVLQRVIVTDEGGRVHVLEYRMEPAGETWKIAGVRILEAAGVGA